MDLVKTIADDEDVEEDNSEDESDVDKTKPSVLSKQAKGDFDNKFHFVGNIDEYHYDSWSELAKYVKEKKYVKRSIDERIAASTVSRKRQQDDDLTMAMPDVEVEDDADHLMSESYDVVSTKDKKGKKRPQRSGDLAGVKVEDDDGYFEKNKQFGQISSFHQMNLSRPLLKAITAMNFVTPTPVQAAAIPVGLLGRDICGCAATGTGKTAAYMLPILERLLFKPHGSSGTAVTRVLVLVPTRELGVQVFQVAKQLSQFTRIQIGLSVGGLDIKAQEASLRSNPDIVIATPGRLIDHIHNTPTFHLDDIELLILDEADRMLDEHFADQLNEIIKECSPTRQTMLFSATMTESVEDLATLSLKRPVKIFIDSNQSVAENLQQEFIKIRKNQENDREAILAALLTRTFHDHVIVFVPTKKGAHHLHVLLGLLGIKAGELHGDMNQIERLNTLKRFKEDEYDVLLATDVAARGLDIYGVKTVINYELPNSFQHYIHRVGRTARAGRVGRSVSLVGEKERRLFREIIRNSKNPVKSRSIPSEVIAKFKQDLEDMSVEAERILEEEATDKELKRADNTVCRADQIMNNKEPPAPGREWFEKRGQKRPQEDQPMEPMSGRKKKRLEDKQHRLQKKLSKEVHPLNWRHQRKMDALQKEADFQVRCAKRAGKQPRIRAFNDRNGMEDHSKPSRSFEVDLTNTSRQAVKKLKYKTTEFRKEERQAKKPFFGQGGRQTRVTKQGKKEDGFAGKKHGGFAGKKQGGFGGKKEGGFGGRKQGGFGGKKEGGFGGKKEGGFGGRKQGGFGGRKQGGSGGKKQGGFHGKKQGDP
ncbi:unnamed protein product [Notodromas monacha]|uniref:RNA helicase n=1 Tax=Notodromas monacha TaxID=399045 RepID=A0A7R9BNK0_9CRUS|nr:unnamed protein product [Notodromas monacha]CAG0918810.1 unnamed protein product [Notodromas monacha]